MAHLRNKFEYKVRKNGSKKLVTLNGQASKTDPSFRDDCDVNIVLKRFMKTRTPLPEVTGRYIDTSEVPDLHTALNELNKAQSLFDALPADIRARFGNSPVEMVKFLQDPKNVEEGIKLGLMVPKPGPELAPAGTNRRAVGKNKNQSSNDDDDLNDDDDKNSDKKNKK